MNYFGGVLGFVAEIWFFTDKNVSFGKKIAAIIVFLIVVTILLALLAVIAYASHAGNVILGLIGVLELMFIGCGIIWTMVSVYVKRDIEMGKLN